MKEIKGPNVVRTKEFNSILHDLMENMYDLMELSKEHDLQSVSEKGVILYSDEEGKTCFQVSRQFDRPTEFLQTLLDIVRVNFEPFAPGTFLLNSNMLFLYENIPNEPFYLGYISLVSGPDETFGQFYSQSVVPYLERCGYTLDDISATFAAISTGHQRYGMELLEDTLETLNAGFSIDEVFSAFSEYISESGDTITKKECYAGFCLDPALETRVRLSLLFFIPYNQNAPGNPEIH